MSIFSTADSLGSRSATSIAEYLESIENEDHAALFRRKAVSGQAGLGFTKPYSHTGLIVGFVPSGDEFDGSVQSAGKLTADRTLIDKRIKITLDRFHVCDFPGFGKHKILCEFSGKNQVVGETEELRFALRFVAKDNDAAAITGKPIFMGLTVGQDGISFEGRTINVSSKSDEMLLNALESPAFKNGLALITTAQPALKPFSALAEAAVKATAKRSLNTQVHNFDIGLDFSNSNTSVRLRLGAYIVVQTDLAHAWTWSNFKWSAEALALVRTDAQAIDFNYMVFGVESYAGE